MGLKKEKKLQKIRQENYIFFDLIQKEIKGYKKKY